MSSLKVICQVGSETDFCVPCGLVHLLDLDHEPCQVVPRLGVNNLSRFRILGEHLDDVPCSGSVTHTLDN